MYALGPVRGIKMFALALMPGRFRQSSIIDKKVIRQKENQLPIVSKKEAPLGDIATSCLCEHRWSPMQPGGSERGNLRKVETDKLF
jgi:hypothetical protein